MVEDWNNDDDDDDKFCQNGVIFGLFNAIVFLLSCISLKFRYWFNFHVSIIIGSEVMAIFIYKEFDQKSEN